MEYGGGWGDENNLTLDNKMKKPYSYIELTLSKKKHMPTAENIYLYCRLFNKLNVTK